MRSKVTDKNPLPEVLPMPEVDEDIIDRICDAELQNVYDRSDFDLDMIAKDVSKNPYIEKQMRVSTFRWSCELRYRSPDLFANNCIIAPSTVGIKYTGMKPYPPFELWIACAKIVTQIPEMREAAAEFIKGSQVKSGLAPAGEEQEKIFYPDPAAFGFPTFFESRDLIIGFARYFATKYVDRTAYEGRLVLGMFGIKPDFQWRSNLDFWTKLCAFSSVLTEQMTSLPGDEKYGR